MGPLNVFLVFSSAAAIGVAGIAHAQVYKWTDEKGVVNYSSTPPPKGRSATIVNEDSGRVSTLPTDPTARDGQPSASERALRDRVDRLEQDAAAQRQAAGANDAAAQEAYRRWYDQCRADRRVDCDNPVGYNDPGYGVAYPPGVVRPGQRPMVPNAPGQYRPTPNVAEGGGGVVGPYFKPPPGGVAAGSGPAGIGTGYSPAPPGGVVVAPGPGGAGAQYVPVPPTSVPPPGGAVQRPRATPMPLER